MARERRRLTRGDKEEAFRIATRSLPRRYADEITRGMTDAELTQALKEVLGIWGGSCEPGRLDVLHQGSGLKIWAGWHIVNHVTEAPIFRGRETLAMARVTYGIRDPGDRQMPLL